MPTRKQRARRAKSFRHEYGFVVNDEEGNEVEVERSELRPDKKKESGKSAAKSGAKAKTRSSRALREPPPPSWDRALRRGGLWGAATVVLSVVLLKGISVPTRAAIGLLYAVMFIPLTYWIDGMVYRRFIKRNPGTPKPR
jgi:hypothetical protein